MPVYILLFPVYRIDLALGIFGTYAALILPYVAVSIPFNTLLLTGFLREFPGEIEEAAIIDGAGLWRLCTSVVLPLMRPVIATILIFNVVYVFNEFPFASILINDPSMVTVSLAVSRFQGQYTVDYGGMMASATLVLLPQLIIYAIFQRHVIAGHDGRCGEGVRPGAPSGSGLTICTAPTGRALRRRRNHHSGGATDARSMIGHASSTGWAPSSRNSSRPSMSDVSVSTAQAPIS